MRAFHCDNCAQLIFFDNDRCLRCGSPLGYVHERRTLITLAEVAPGRLVEFAQPTTGWQRCATSTTTACNWLVRTDQGALCESCALTRTRPADEDAEGMEENLRAEMA